MREDSKKKLNELKLSPNIPSIFKTVLNKEYAFAQAEEYLDAMIISREYQNGLETFGNIHSRAKMIIATNYGLIFIEEGDDEPGAEIAGFKIQHVLYSKISSVELDMCLLAGSFVIHTDFGNRTGIEIKFNTAQYQYEFARFLEVVRNQQIEFLMLKQY